MEEVKIGDVVALKADATRNKMTVGSIEGNEAECVWFDANSQLHKEVIKVAALKTV